MRGRRKRRKLRLWVVSLYLCVCMCVCGVCLCGLCGVYVCVWCVCVCCVYVCVHVCGVRVYMCVWCVCACGVCVCVCVWCVYVCVWCVCVCVCVVCMVCMCVCVCVYVWCPSLRYGFASRSLRVVCSCLSMTHIKQTPWNTPDTISRPRYKTRTSPFRSDPLLVLTFSCHLCHSFYMDDCEQSITVTLEIAIPVSCKLTIAPRRKVN